MTSRPLYNLYVDVPPVLKNEGNRTYQEKQVFLDNLELDPGAQIPTNRFVDMDGSIALAMGINQEHVEGAPRLYPFDWRWATKNQIKSKKALPLGPQN